MLAFLLQGQGGFQKLLFGAALRGEKVGHFGRPAGDGAGFVQHRNLRPARLFQGDRGFKQDAVPGPPRRCPP